MAIFSPIYIPWLIGVSLLVIVCDSIFSVMSIFEAAQCIPTVCPEGALPWVWLAGATGTFAIVALFTIGIVWVIRSILRHPSHTVDGHVIAIGHHT